MTTEKEVENTIRRLSAPDRIEVYKTHGKWRWTRKTQTNFKVVATSSDEYPRLETALKNIDRTQKPPYDIQVME